MKRNTGIITRVTIADQTFECDGYIKYDIMQSLLTWQEINALTFTDFLGSSERAVRVYLYGKRGR